RRDGGRPEDTCVVLIKFDCRNHDALNTDAVAAHDNRHTSAIGSQHIGIHTFGIARTEFENMPDFNGFEYINRRSTRNAAFACIDSAKARPFIYLNVALDTDASQMVVVLVRTGGHITATLQGFISDNLRDEFMRCSGDADCAERTG